MPRVFYRLPMLRMMLRAAGHMFSPAVCQICGQTLAVGESLMCSACLMDMPRTSLERYTFNEIHKRLGPSSPVDRAASLFYYSRGSRYARLLINAKYDSRPAQARELGRLCAEELEPSGLFCGLDALVPVPMHWTKRLTRGYNQTMEACRGISDVIGIPTIPLLKARSGHGVLSRLRAWERRQAVEGTFAATAEADRYDRASLMVVDDIITTGATMSEAIKQLHAAAPSATLHALGIALTVAT